MNLRFVFVIINCFLFCFCVLFLLTSMVCRDRGNVDSVVMPTPRSLLFSSDDEYRTASEGGRRESGEWGEALPPSPPLNRTPMSRVKERARYIYAAAKIKSLAIRLTLNYNIDYIFIILDWNLFNKKGNFSSFHDKI